MGNIGYPYTYEDKNEDKHVKTVKYEFQLVDKTIDFCRGIIHKTYKIIKVVSKNGILQKLKIGFCSFIVVLGLKFEGFRQLEPVIQSQTQIERQLVTNKKSNFSDEELKSLEVAVNDQTILVKDVDGFTVVPNYPSRKSSSGRTEWSSSTTHGSRPPRAPSGFQRMPIPHKSVENHGFYGEVTGLGGSSDADSGSPEYGFDPDNSNVNRESSDQCSDSSYSYPSKKRKKNNIEVKIVDGQIILRVTRDDMPFFIDEMTARKKIYHAPDFDVALLIGGERNEIFPSKG